MTIDTKRLPVCACNEFWPEQGHHPECPVWREYAARLDEIDRLREQLAMVRELHCQHCDGLNNAKDVCEFCGGTDRRVPELEDDDERTD